MATTLVISGLSCALMIASVLIKPYIKVGRIKLGLYYIICLVGAIALILTNCISFKDVISGITANTAVNPLKILALFLSVTLVSIYLGEAGFFNYVADRVFVKNNGGNFKLFLTLFLTVAVLTVFTSNDIIILTFTPPICIFAKKTKTSPFPFLFGEFISANTFSMALVVGNPTNIYLAGASGITFTQYLSVMWLPALTSGLVGFAVLTFLFRKELFNKKPTVALDENRSSNMVSLNKTTMLVSLISLAILIVLLAVSDFIGIEMWLICVAFALFLSLFHLIYGLFTKHGISLVTKALLRVPYELIPFVLSMFTIVLALKECGFTDILKNALVLNNKYDAFTFSFISGLSANLLNNIPMSVLFEKIISGSSITAVYGAIIGSNIGAFITPVGALAGIMWSKILASYGVKMPFSKFVFYGSIVAFFSLSVASFVLFIV